MNKILAQQVKKAPKRPGVYLFKNKAGELLYIGKAVNLRNRLKQYYFKKTAGSPFLEHMLNEAERVETKTAESEIEALILESRLIKERRPKYNIMLRDDKEYFYVGLTADEFPRIFLTHQQDKITAKKFKAQITNFKSNLNVLNTEYIGPFTDGNALKTTLRLLRRIFPYCTCKKPHNNFCLNYHIGKCLGYCCLKNPELRIKNYELWNYGKNIKAIKDILSGKKESLIKKLRKELGELGKKQEFEKAIELKNKIEKLEKTFENARILRDANIRIHPNDTNSLKEIKRIFKLPLKPNRIEGYDVSNIQGKNAVGAMAVFGQGWPSKNQYRKFKIRRGNEPDDIAMLKEVLVRRFNHPEWPYPDLIFIDGGIAQLNAAIRNTRSHTINIPIISLAKGEQQVFSSTLKKPVPMKKLPAEVQNLISQIDSEAHRFAISYYRKTHRKKLIA